MTRLGRPARILLVEDNPGDVLLTREAFEEARVAVEMVDVGSAPAAIEHLTALPDRALPDLVLLDLNLPGPPGTEVLEHVRATARLQHLPVIMLTTSQAPEDILDAYRRSANSFISKPVKADEFITAVKTLEDYWLTVVRLPSH